MLHALLASAHSQLDEPQQVVASTTANEAIDHVLLAWARNTGSLSLAEVFGLAIGTSIEF